MSTFDRVKNVMISSLNVDEGKITENSKLGDDLGLDSLEQAELIMALEEEFKCEIPEDASEGISTVKEAVEYLDKLSK